jgi:hypothetical protein
MQPSLNNLAYAFSLVLNAGAMSIAIYRLNSSNNGRTRPLWKLAFADGVSFTVALLLSTMIVPLESMLDTLTLIFYVWLEVQLPKGIFDF